jgi:uridylate kinase
MKPYKRVLLKISGEMLMGAKPFGMEEKACLTLAVAIQELRDSGLDVGIVIGGGNIFRGVSLGALGMARTPADQMGMLATLMNGVALQQALESVGCPSKVLSALECPRVVETYNWNLAREYFYQRKVIIFVGGTGNPYFTTDTAAAMRACEIEADILLKATKVDGIYTKDPLKFPDAVKYDSITYAQVLAEKLEVMDATAIALCQRNQLPILVFNMHLLAEQQLKKVLSHEEGTLVKGE